MKHLIQLTEYVTGLNARIGFPNEHLSSGHIDELAKPMYSTCIGLILKGYNVFENTQNKLKGIEIKEEPVAEVVNEYDDQTETHVVRVKKRKSLKGFMDSIKDGLIDLFNEEEDRKL